VLRRGIPLSITFIVGVVMIVSYFIPIVEGAQDLFSSFYLIIAAFAIILGIGNLILTNVMKIKKKRADWPFSFITLAGLAVMASAGIYNDAEGGLFDHMFYFIYTPLSATMFALLAFFVASASYRAFRARTKEATVLLIAAFLVMMGRVPLGDMLYAKLFFWLPQSWDFLKPSSISDWIMNFPNLAGQRAILIGAALGVVSASLRLITGLERTYLGGE
jgi:hypothetical protein